MNTSFRVFPVLVLMMIAVGTLYACTGSKPRSLVCSHPAVGFGAPFPVTARHFFLNDGGLHIEVEKDTVILYGAVCVDAPAMPAETSSK